MWRLTGRVACPILWADISEYFDATSLSYQSKCCPYSRCSSHIHPFQILGFWAGVLATFSLWSSLYLQNVNFSWVKINKPNFPATFSDLYFLWLEKLQNFLWMWQQKATKQLARGSIVSCLRLRRVLRSPRGIFATLNLRADKCKCAQTSGCSHLTLGLIAKQTYHKAELQWPLVWCREGIRSILSAQKVNLSNSLLLFLLLPHTYLYTLVHSGP